LTIEDGYLITMEKVRTRSQAVDKLVEFVTEFTDVERLAILQNLPHTSESSKMLLDRLVSETDVTDFPTSLYGPVLASYLGLDATGLAVLERETLGDSEGI
jgi:fatty acid-binding protein DegV